MQKIGNLLNNQNPYEFFDRVRESESENDPRRAEKSRGYLAEPNTTQIPNEFFDFYMAGMDEDMIKVMLYTLRHTFGYGKKNGDFITETQFIEGTVKKSGKRIDWGCGIGKPKDSFKAKAERLRRTIRKLEELGLMEVQRGSRRSSNDKYTTNYYRAKIKAVGEE